ncbi:histone-lysine N-methyltransferase 2D-like isoform X2 [Ctenopharyngodon idella]|nr:histone-lysine N-methyltransferase 2D-like isoform X2 [Ctenopharyngodon idella]
MLPPSLPLPPPLSMPSSSSALSTLVRFCPSAPPSVTSPSYLDLLWVFWSPALPWCGDPLAPPRASEPIDPPWPIDSSALATPSAPPETIIFLAPLGSLIPLASPCQSSLYLYHRLLGLLLCLILPPLRVHRPPPSLQLLLSPHSHWLCLSPPALWFHLSHLSPRLLPWSSGPPGVTWSCHTSDSESTPHLASPLLGRLHSDSILQPSVPPWALILMALRWVAL